MIAKTGTKEGRRREKEPLEVFLTVKMNFGDTPDEAISVMTDRRVPMVDSVFANRDRILRGFVSMLLKTSWRSAAVTRELFPVIRLLKRK
ncbi:MAG: hypothetical protein ACRETW_08330 [Stenotrophobium sp.]